MLDMTNSIPLRMIHAGRPEEQTEEECQDGQALHRVQTKAPTKRPVKKRAQWKMSKLLPSPYSFFVYNRENNDPNPWSGKNKHLSQLPPLLEVLTNHQT